MAHWRLRNPNDFPYPFHDALRDGEGRDKIIGRYATEARLKGAAKDWRLFLYCLRSHPLHPLHARATEYKHRTRKQFNHTLREWELLLTSRRSVMEDLIGFSE